MSEYAFDQALELKGADPGWVHGQTSPVWANMVGPFGGITAAVLLHAVEQHPDRLGQPLALTVNFTAPVADGDYDIAVKPIRTNRTTQHWTVELWQDGAVTTNATAVFGKRRDTWSDTEKPASPVPPPDEIRPTGLPGNIVWANQFEMRYVEGPPAVGVPPEPSSVTTLWVRDRAGRELDFASLAAMSDIFYPRVFLRRGSTSPAGTVSLTTYFHADAAELAAIDGDFILCRAYANRFSNGYFDQSGHLWSRAGELLATTHQLVYFKD
ncbi:acyl-CoA thioesterase [Mycolicibacterium sp.]|uniref:acyl-CoA thioesterase n=1 Tax=Mycolicibacterium sp. TaxID=2320850 RepID=UPI003D10BCB9